MALDSIEEEHLDTLKRWWKESGKSVVAGVVIGLALLFAIWTWRDYSSTQAETASAEYQLLIAEVEQGDTQAGLERGERIVNEFSGTPYAVFSALAVAKLALDAGDSGVARNYLQYALANADQPNIEHVARLRLARVMIADGETQAALDLVSSVEPGSFLSAYEEIKGDIHVSMGEPQLARTAYQTALEALEDADPEEKALLRMKLDDLGNVPEPEAPT